MTAQGGKQDHRLGVLEEPRKPGIIMGRRPGDTSGNLNSTGLVGSLTEDSADVSTIQVSGNNSLMELDGIFAAFPIVVQPILHGTRA